MTRSGWPPGPTLRPYPVADLARAIGLNPTDTQALSLALGVGRRWIRRYRDAGLTERQADDWACRAGIHPCDVWPRWYDLHLHGRALINANRSTCPAHHPYDRTDTRGYRICTTCRTVARQRLRANTQVTALAAIDRSLMGRSAPHLTVMIPTVPERDVLRPSEVADHLQVSEATLKRWRSLGDGPAYIHIGRNIRYLQADLDAYLTAQRIDPRATAS